MKEKLKSLRGRIITIIMCFSSLIALSVALLSLFVSRRYLEENQAQSSYITLQLIGNEINSDLNAVLGFTDRLLLDEKAEEYLKEMAGPEGEDPNGSRRLSMEVWDHLNNEYGVSAAHDLIPRFVLSTPGGEKFLQVARIPGTSTVKVTESIMELPCFEELYQSSGYRYIGLIPSPVNLTASNPVIPLIRRIPNSRTPDTVGWIYAEIDSAAIMGHIENPSLPEDSELYITFGDRVTYRYDNGNFIVASLPEGVTDFDLPGKPIRLSLLPSASEMRSRSRTQLLIILGILLFIHLAGIGIYYLLRRMINDPVEALLAKLKKVGKGDFSRDAGIEWDNEFGQIGKGINDLSDNVDALIGRRIEDEREKQALEYRILQSQINPHFMYNTLNTIKWMAAIQGADGIADMSTALSRLLKNVSKVQDSLIPLKDEIALLDDYYTIMKYRYGGTIELEYDIKDESLTECLVNRFSLQPIVENAIFHGIEPKGSAGRIGVSVSGEGDILMIDVTDNGVGMDEETIERVLRGEEESANDFFKDVGLANVNSRIRFAFGEDYGLTVESVPGDHTTVHYRIPAVYADKGLDQHE